MLFSRTSLCVSALVSAIGFGISEICSNNDERQSMKRSKPNYEQTKNYNNYCNQTESQILQLRRTNHFSIEIFFRSSQKIKKKLIIKNRARARASIACTKKIKSEKLLWMRFVLFLDVVVVIFFSWNFVFSFIVFWSCVVVHIMSPSCYALTHVRTHAVHQILKTNMTKAMNSNDGDDDNDEKKTISTFNNH